MVFLSLPLYKGQTMTKLAENGRKWVTAFCVVVIEVAGQTMEGKGGQVEKKWPGIKWQNKASSIFG